MSAYYIPFHSSPARANIEAAGRDYQKARLAEEARRRGEAEERKRVEHLANLRVRAELAAQAREIKSAIMSSKTWWTDIIAEVCKKHGMTTSELMDQRLSRRQCFVFCRQEVMFRLRRETTLSTFQIGQKLGGFDHSTVIHAVKAYERRVAASADRVAE